MGTEVLSERLLALPGVVTCAVAEGGVTLAALPGTDLRLLRARAEAACALAGDARSVVIVAGEVPPRPQPAKTGATAVARRAGRPDVVAAASALALALLTVAPSGGSGPDASTPGALAAARAGDPLGQPSAVDPGQGRPTLGSEVRRAATATASTATGVSLETAGVSAALALAVAAPSHPPSEAGRPEVVRRASVARRAPGEPAAPPPASPALAAPAPLAQPAPAQPAAAAPDPGPPATPALTPVPAPERVTRATTVPAGPPAAATPEGVAPRAPDAEEEPGDRYRRPVEPPVRGGVGHSAPPPAAATPGGEGRGGGRGR